MKNSFTLIELFVVIAITSAIFLTLHASKRRNVHTHDRLARPISSAVRRRLRKAHLGLSGNPLWVLLVKKVGESLFFLAIFAIILASKLLTFWMVETMTWFYPHDIFSRI